MRSLTTMQAWVAAKHYADLMLQPVTKGPVMVHHIPRFLRHRRAAGETKVALLVFDGLGVRSVGADSGAA
jgi:hypothetical protein